MTATATRKRTTWSESGDGSSRAAATSRTADPYTMNQEHPQPGPTDYETGNPDAWAETPTKNENVEAEYEGGRVKRNEIGLGEFREDTFGKDREFGDRKYENKTAANRKASAAERVARAILRTSDEKLVGNQALDLMHLPAKSLVATLRRLDKVSPDSLPKEMKFKRALACCKLAARVLGFTEEDVKEGTKANELNQRLAGVLMTIDDPTLKSILGHVAAARVADDDDDKGDDDGDTSSTVPVATGHGDDDKGDDDDGDTAGAAGAGPENVAAKPSVAMPPAMPPPAMPEVDACGMGVEDMDMLDSMLQQEMGQPVPAQPVGELTELFEGGPAPMGDPMAVPAMPAMASQGPDIDITFGDDEGEARTASAEDDSQLNSLFADDPEVQAQRDIVAAQQDQRAREGGYVPGSRTASAGGARKLGNVRGGKPNVDDGLADLWDRPGA